jgi:hypothetical protein
MNNIVRHRLLNLHYEENILDRLLTNTMVHVNVTLNFQLIEHRIDVHLW